MCYLYELNSTKKNLTVIFLGNTASTSIGFMSLVKQVSFLSAFIQLSETAHGDLRLECLKSWSCLFAADTAQLNQNEYLILESEMGSLYAKAKINGKSLLSICLTLAKSAFEEERIAAYALMKSLSMHSWSVHEIYASSDYIRFLMDRSSEAEKKGKEWRYAIIQTLVLSANTFKIDHPVVQVLKTYIKDGPYFIEREANVAIASQ